MRNTYMNVCDWFRPVIFLTLLVMAQPNYWTLKEQILQEEKRNALGGQVSLNEKETLANEILLKAKLEELKCGYADSTTFLPAHHFMNVKRKMENSEVFKIIRKFPKGGNLHTHFLGSVDADFILKNITYRKKLYGCFTRGTYKLKFFNEDDLDGICEWELIEDKRKDPNFDQWLRTYLTLECEDPKSAYPTIESVWKKFKQIFTTVYDMVSYRPVFEDYLFQSLQELYDDNVMYVEFRGTIMQLYELDGTVYDASKFFEVFQSVVEKFQSQHPNFIGARYIDSIYRGANDDDIEKFLNNFKNYPTNIMTGIDLVGFEEEGRNLEDLVKIFQKFSGNIPFFFHAGESSWYGHTDMNIIDAVLLKCSRIGHGYGLLKHPSVIQVVKTNGIALEINPISNQVLMLVDDLRNHPAAAFIAQGLPIVIGNDDPGNWGATGLSYDWYVIFMAMTRKDVGLEFMKEVALNSIRYSCLTDLQKKDATEKWNRQWDIFIDNMIN